MADLEGTTTPTVAWVEGKEVDFLAAADCLVAPEVACLGAVDSAVAPVVGYLEAD